MARVNIEECWWSDPRRTKLMLKIGFYADAAAVNMWRVGQKFWGENRRLVPEEIFYSLEYAKELIDVGLAELRTGTEQDPNGRSVYVRGSSQYLDWHHEQRKQASEAGKQSAKNRKKKYGSAQPYGGKGTPKSERNPNGVRTEPNGTEPSGSVSVSDSVSGSVSGSEKLTKAVAKAPAPPESLLNASIWKSYSEAYFRRYGTEPVRNAKVNSQIAQLGKRLGNDAVSVVRFYVGHNNSIYVRRTHEVGLCLSDCEGLRTQWATNRPVTQKQAANADSDGALADQLRRIERGEV